MIYVNEVSRFIIIKTKSGEAQAMLDTENGTVETSGNPEHGGDSSKVQDKLINKKNNYCKL